MNITFLKSLIVSFGFHALAISLFLMEGKEFKRSETSMTEIIILSSTENNKIEKKKVNIQKTTNNVKDKITEQKNLVSQLEKNENEFYKDSKVNLTFHNPEKKDLNNSSLENKSLKNPDNTKKPLSDKINNFSENQKTTSIFKSSATYKIGSVKNPHPTYPLIARKKGWEGRVIIQAEIDSKGNVSEIKVLKSSGFKVLDNAGLETLKEWKFAPAMIGNKFVDDTVNIPVKFLITN
jgi:TonB family protein